MEAWFQSPSEGITRMWDWAWYHLLVSALSEGIRDLMWQWLRKASENPSPWRIMETVTRHVTAWEVDCPIYWINGYVPWPIPEGKFGFIKMALMLTLEIWPSRIGRSHSLQKPWEKTLQGDWSWTVQLTCITNTFDKESGLVRPKIGREMEDAVNP